MEDGREGVSTGRDGASYKSPEAIREIREDLVQTESMKRAGEGKHPDGGEGVEARTGWLQDKEELMTEPSETEMDLEEIPKISILAFLAGETKKSSPWITHLRLAGELPEEEVKRAAAAYAQGVDPEAVIGTGKNRTGKGKVEFLFTENDFYSSCLKPGTRLPLRELVSAERVKDGLYIVLKDGRSMIADFGKENRVVLGLLKGVRKALEV